MPNSVETPVLAELLEQNASWAAGIIASDPNFFINSATTPQTPKVCQISSRTSGLVSCV